MIRAIVSILTITILTQATFANDLNLAAGQSIDILDLNGYTSVTCRSASVPTCNFCPSFTGKGSYISLNEICIGHESKIISDTYDSNDETLAAIKKLQRDGICQGLNYVTDPVGNSRKKSNTVKSNNSTNESIK